MGELIFIFDKMRFQLISNFFWVSVGRICVYINTHFLKHFLENFKVGDRKQHLLFCLLSWTANMRSVEEVKYCSCIRPMVRCLKSFKKCDASVRALKHKTIMSWKLYYQSGSKSCLFCNSGGNCSLKNSRQNSFRQSSYVCNRQYTLRTSITSTEIPLKGTTAIMFF